MHLQDGPLCRRCGVQFPLGPGTGPCPVCEDEREYVDWAGQRWTTPADLAAEGRAVVVSTHDVEFAAAATHRTIVMADGDVIADGPTRQVCTSSPTFAPQTAKVFAPVPVLVPAEIEVVAP